MFRCRRPHTHRPDRPYHHGDLRAALLSAAEAVIGERGVAGFSLREAARRAGVSHAAPAHHFGDARGLLTALAARGFDELAASMATEVARLVDAPAPARRRAIGLGYVRFALTRPVLFRLMFRPDAVDCDAAALRTAGDAAFAFLRQATGATSDTGATPDWPALILNWSVVHGFAMLALDGPLKSGAPMPLDTPALLALAEAMLARLETSGAGR